MNMLIECVPEWLEITLIVFAFVAIIAAFAMFLALIIFMFSDR